MKLSILLKKREFLQKLSDLSYRYNVINKNYPLTRLKENEFDLIEKEYDEILKEVILLAEKIKEEIKNF